MEKLSLVQFLIILPALIIINLAGIYIVSRQLGSLIDKAVKEAFKEIRSDK